MHIAPVTGVDKLLLPTYTQFLIVISTIFQWSISVKDIKMLWWLIKLLHVGAPIILTPCVVSQMCLSTKALLLACLHK